jgi:amino-acid N-acetyltransferase
MDMAKLRIANNDDVELLTKFIGRAGLTAVGINEHIDHFLIVEKDDGELLGTAGVEPHKNDGLIRSLVVKADGGTELLIEMFQFMISFAKQKKMNKLFLMTGSQKNTTQLFDLLGFKEVNEGEIPDHIQQSSHVKQLKDEKSAKIMALAV